MIRPKRGDIYPAIFDPSVGAEVRKTRPAVVLKSDIANKSSLVTIMAAIEFQVRGSSVVRGGLEIRQCKDGSRCGFGSASELDPDGHDLSPSGRRIHRVKLRCGKNR